MKARSGAFFVAGMLLCHLAWAQPAPVVPTLSCKSSALTLNTGYDQGTGQLIANGSQDLQWWVSSTQSDPNGNIGPGISATWKPTSVPYAASLPAAWVTASALGNQTNWIAPDPTAVTYVRPPAVYPYNPPVVNYYRMQFQLSPEVDPGTLTFGMNYYNDDAMLGVFVNNSFQPLPPSGFAPGSVATAQLSGPWVTGLNTVIFSVKDFGWQSGLLAHIDSSTPLCSGSPIGITKTIDKPSYLQGETVTYTVTVSNMGAMDVTGATLTDPSPSGLANGGWSCTASGGASCPVVPMGSPIGFDLVAGGQLTFSLTGTAMSSGSLRNTATLSPGAGGVCAANTGCSATVDATIAPAPNLTPSWTSAQGQLAVGQSTPFQVTVSNIGTQGSTDGVLTITLPANMIFSSGQVPPANCSISGTAMTCSLSALAAAGGSTAISFKAQATAAFTGENLVAVVSQVTGETLLSDNTANAPVNAAVPPNIPVKPVPALGEWALIGLFALLALLGGLQRVRRRGA